MSDESQAMERITDRVLGLGIRRVWERLAPLSTGAVASSAVVVVAGAILRRALDPQRGRALRWIGFAALVPLGLWLLARRSDEDAAALDDQDGRPVGHRGMAKAPEA